MSKAEERVLEQYPVEMYEGWGWRCVDKNEHKRKYYIEGYHQAEKDLALTWQDVRRVILIYERMATQAEWKYVPIEQFYTEVLKRFLESKKV